MLWLGLTSDLIHEEHNNKPQLIIICRAHVFKNVQHKKLQRERHHISETMNRTDASSCGFTFSLVDIWYPTGFSVSPPGQMIFL